MVNPLSGDVGWAGAFVPMLVGESTLLELRNLAGPPPTPGKSWVLVDLKTGEFKWYTGGGGRGYRRGSYRSSRRGR